MEKSTMTTSMSELQALQEGIGEAYAVLPVQKLYDMITELKRLKEIERLWEEELKWR